MNKHKCEGCGRAAWIHVQSANSGKSVWACSIQCLDSTGWWITDRRPEGEEDE